MKRNFFMATLLLCFLAVCVAAAITDMNGQWSAVFNAPDGNNYPLTYSFKVDGSKLTGTLDAAGMSTPIDSGKVDGENVSFSVTVQDVTYLHKGKYYTGADSIGMDVTYTGNNGHITLTRPK